MEQGFGALFSQGILGEVEPDRTQGGSVGARELRIDSEIKD